MGSDEQYIRMCIKLAEQAVAAGDSPFGSVIVDNKGLLIAESCNKIKACNDVTMHAEIVVMRAAQRKMGRYNSEIGGYDFTGYTLYSNCEPCPMCSFVARELKFSRIVFALSSPLMGGWTKWKVLQDEGLSQARPFFSEVPEIVSGVLKEEALSTMHKIGWYFFG